MVWSDFCAVAPAPELADDFRKEIAKARGGKSSIASILALARAPRYPGFDDGVILPPDQFPPGTSMREMKAAAADRAPLRGSVRVIVVLVQFSDHAMTQTAAHFHDLFFSTGVLPHGSVNEYYTEVTGGLVNIVGEVVGPYQLPQTLAWYANGNFGIGQPSGTPRANIMARDAALAADPHVDFSSYDNDGNGFVDAFIVVHAGRGGEQTGNSGDIWSHKWTLPSAYSADGKQIYAYLTIPEDARIGVCAHELGHLLFGFPDLYDTDYTSEGIGNWCLMAGGSWNGGGDIPAHPSAWCKANQGWASVTNVTASGTLSIPDVKASHNVHRLWKDGAGGSEYFLVENRQKTGFDAQLPADGLLIWHIDEAQPGNTDENHYKVGLMQADGQRDLELDHNRGDGGDPYPGSAANTSFTPTSTPNSNSYSGQNTCVSVTRISGSGPTMTAMVQVSCGKSLAKDSKDRKDVRKDFKEIAKDRKDAKDRIKDRVKEFDKERIKDRIKDVKEVAKDRKDLKDRFEGKNDLKDWIDQKKGPKEIGERPGDFGRRDDLGAAQGQDGGSGDDMFADIESRLATLEAALGLGQGAEAFIGGDLRPDLQGGPNYDGQDDLQQRMADGDRDAKASFDTLPQRS
jgi:immune inhibitor A